MQLSSDDSEGGMAGKNAFVDRDESYRGLLRSVRHFRLVEVVLGLSTIDVHDRISNPNSARRFGSAARIANFVHILLLWGGLAAAFSFWLWMLAGRGEVSGISLVNVDAVASCVYYGSNFVAVICLRFAWFWQGEAFVRVWKEIYDSPDIGLMEGVRMPFLKPLMLTIVYTLALTMRFFRETLNEPIIKGQVELSTVMMIGIGLFLSVLTTWVKMAGKVLPCYIYRLGVVQIRNVQALLRRPDGTMDFVAVKASFTGIEDMSRLLSRAVAPIMVVTVTSDLIDLVSSLYFSITRLIGARTEFANGAVVVLRYFTPLGIVVACILGLIWLCEEGQKFQDAMEDFRRNMHRMNTFRLDEKSRGELALLLTQLNGEVGPPSVAGFFNVNRRLLIGILGSTTTYLIVLLQSYVAVPK